MSNTCVFSEHCSLRGQSNQRQRFVSVWRFLHQLENTLFNSNCIYLTCFAYDVFGSVSKMSVDIIAVKQSVPSDEI